MRKVKEYRSSMPGWVLPLFVSVALTAAGIARADQPPPETQPEAQGETAAGAAAEDTAAPDAPQPEPAEPLSPASYDDLRNPFWPVGYSPPRVGDRIVVPRITEPAEKAPEPPKWDEATKRLGIKGVMTMGDGKYMAVVNNQIVREGDIVMVAHAGKRYRWKVHAITKGGVRFEPLDVAEEGAQAK